jgi:hypothetical protein
MHAGPASTRRLLVLSLVACLVAAIGGLFTVGTATAASPTAPASIVIDTVSSAQAAPSGTPGTAVPYVLVKAGDPFVVHVSFYDASGAPASFNNDTTLAIGSNAGTLSPSTGVALKDAMTADLTTSLPTAANQVSLTVGVANAKLARTVTAGTSAPAQLFDVLKDLRLEGSTPNFQQGIGGNANCTDATKADPVCAVVILPVGAASSNVLLSLGSCADSTYTGCGSSRGSVVQTLADLSGLYSNTAPATMLFKCDKSLCGGGSIQDKHVSFSLLGNSALQTAPACPAKGTVGDGQVACLDYVQSQRDGAGDTLLYLLFTQDMRGSLS